MRSGDAIAGVFHRQAHAAVAFRREADVDAAAGRRVADRVADQIRECAVQFLGRAPQIDAGEIFGGDRVPALAQRIGFALERRQHRRHRDDFLGQFFLGFQSRQHQQILDQLCHALRLALHLVEHRRPFRMLDGIEHVQIAVDDGQRGAQFVRHVGDEIAAHLFQMHEFADVARDEQPELVGIRNQTQAQAQVGLHRRCGIEQRFRVAAAGQPVRDRQRLQAIAECRAEIAGIVQAQQPGRGFVEPLDALAVALDHDDGVGQRGGGGAVGAQHVDQPALARPHLVLAAIEQAVQLIPDPRAGGWREPLPRGEPQEQLAQFPVVPGDHAERGEGDHRPDVADGEAERKRDRKRQRELAEGLEPCGSSVVRHPLSLWESLGQRLRIKHGRDADHRTGDLRRAGSMALRAWPKSDSRRRARSGPCRRAPPVPAPDAAGGYARPRCAPRRRCCRPRRGPAADCGCRRVRRGS